MWLDEATLKEAVENGVKFTLRNNNLEVIASDKKNEITDNKSYVKINLINEMDKEIYLFPVFENIVKYLKNNQDKFSEVQFSNFDEEEILSISGETLNIIAAYIVKKFNLSGKKADISTPEYSFFNPDLNNIQNKNYFRIIIDNLLLFYIIV